MTGRVDRVDLIFGLTEGWWKFSDHELRPSHPLLGRQEWLDLIRQQGFTGGATIPGIDVSNDKSFPQTVLVAREPNGERPCVPEPDITPVTEVTGTWLVFADQGGMGRILAERIRLRGQSCVLVFPSESYKPPLDGMAHIDPVSFGHFERLLGEVTAPGRPPLAGVVHLWCLDATGPEQTTRATLGGQLIPCAVVEALSIWHRR